MPYIKIAQTVSSNSLYIPQIYFMGKDTQKIPFC